MSLDQNGEDVLGLSVQYFDTIAPATQLTLLESGFLFSAGDSSNHIMYKFTSLGADEVNPVMSNSTMTSLVRFCPRGDHENLQVTDQI